MLANSIFVKKNYDGHFHVDVQHSYYYQVQAQIKLCSVQFCDCVVWRKEELLIERILPNADFILDGISKCKQFIKLAFLPEMLGRQHTKKSTSTINVESNEPDTIESSDPTDCSPATINPNHPAKPESEQENQQVELWCYCRIGESGEIIRCHNNSCNIRTVVPYTLSLHC